MISANSDPYIQVSSEYMYRPSYPAFSTSLNLYDRQTESAYGQTDHMIEARLDQEKDDDDDERDEKRYLQLGEKEKTRGERGEEMR